MGEVRSELLLVSPYFVPGAGLWLRLQAAVLSWLPIEALL